MEATVLSGPLGHTQWESELPFPLGFHSLDSDNGSVLCQNKGGQTGLDFLNSDLTSQQSEEENIYQDKPAGLDNLINISAFSCGDLQFEGDQSNISKASLHGSSIEELSFTELTEPPDELSDYTLSWLFSPQLTDVVGKNTAHEELTLTQEAPPESSNSLSSEAGLISLSIPGSPLNISNTGDPFLLVDLLSYENSCLPAESSGELNPQGVSEELVDLSQEEQTGLPPSLSRETLSPETGDKGLFPDQVTDLLVTCSIGSPENCLPHDHVNSTPLESLEGSVPLLDSDVPDCDSSVSLCPASLASVICTGAPLDLSTEESEVEHAGATVNRNVTLDQGENDSFAPGLSAEPSSLTCLRLKMPSSGENPPVRVAKRKMNLRI
ncbi:hypothetical protein PBY51_001561 [Eleginops maclovinus]|uniref:Uncharacterized protein n=1 Tax=Eleginops maclovinus TaxID=56733 RepID=A0AAN8AD58_ELEMC|nr:hypothetical protein PBY51_001561 [Eleginops maclovinus]